jgi:hypothetical protein
MQARREVHMEWPRPVAFALAAAALLVAVPASRADDPGVIPFELEVGASRAVSAGPIREFVCDDGSLVQAVFTDSGVALKGLREGGTLCSFRDAASMRRVLRVVVKPSGPAPSSRPGA